MAGRKGSQPKPLFSGLRVRMGISTGDLPAGCLVSEAATSNHHLTHVLLLLPGG